ncbi:MAG: APC family permease [Acidiferrobacter sp.]
MDHSQPGLASNRLAFLAILGHTLANITPSAMATVTLSLVVADGGSWTWAVYLVVGLLMLLVAMQVAALSQAAPAAGSLFVSVGRSLHPLAGLISGWAMVGGYLGALLAAPVIGGLFLDRAAAIVGVPLPWPPVACAFALLAWWLAVRDVGLAVRYSLAIELVSLVLIVVVGIAALWHSGGSMARVAPPRIQSFFRAMTLSVLAYGGFETAANLGREDRAPRRDIPRAIIVSVIVSLIFYVFMAYAEVSGYGNRIAALAHTAAPLSQLAVADGLSGFAVLSDLAMAMAALSATIATLNSLSRLLYSMGRHRVLPGLFGTTGRHQTPAPALHTLGILTTAFALATALAHWSILSIIDVFGVFTALGFIVIYVLATVAVLISRRRARLPLSPLTLVTLMTAVPLLLYVFVLNFWHAPTATRSAADAFIVFLLAGFVLYATWRRRGGERTPELFLRHDD